MISKRKICIVSSKGGHLLEINRLSSLFLKHHHFWVTFKGKDVDEVVMSKKTYFAYYPESRHIGNFFRNLFLAVKIIGKEKPSALISCGAGIAVPFFIVGKIYRVKLVFIEPFDFVQYPSLTGKILYTFSDLFLVQHKIQLQWYPKAQYWGSLL